jgi:hypothetical protein
MKDADLTDARKLLKAIEDYTKKGAGLDYGGAGANFRKRRIVHNLYLAGMLTSSGHPPERCITGLTDAGRAMLNQKEEEEALP